MVATRILRTKRGSRRSISTNRWFRMRLWCSRSAQIFTAQRNGRSGAKDSPATTTFFLSLMRLLTRSSFAKRSAIWRKRRVGLVLFGHDRIQPERDYRCAGFASPCDACSYNHARLACRRTAAVGQTSAFGNTTRGKVSAYYGRKYRSRLPL